MDRAEKYFTQQISETVRELLTACYEQKGAELLADALTTAIENNIRFYNTKRYQKRLHCMTPMEFHAAA